MPAIGFLDIITLAHSELAASLPCFTEFCGGIFGAFAGIEYQEELARMEALLPQSSVVCR